MIVDFHRWLTESLTHPDITDLCLQKSALETEEADPPLEAFGDFGGTGLHALPLPPQLTGIRASHLHAWIVEQLSQIGKTWDAKNPFVDGQIRLGETLARLHVAFANSTRSGTLVSLRKLPRSRAEGLRKLRWARDPRFETLKNAITAHETILICGATGSGKTTLLSELLTFASPQERILTLEDTPELQVDHPHCVGLLSRSPNADGFGEIGLRRLVREALRMRPDRIVLGECRGEEVLDLLQCLNTGHKGSLVTIHANSCRDGLRRLELLCLLAGKGQIPIPVIRDLIGCGIQWIAFARRESDGRRIAELARVEGKEGDSLLLRPYL